MRTHRKLSVLLLTAFLIAGCTAAQWFQLVNALLPLASDIAIQFATFANKGTVPASDAALIHKYTADVQALFGDINADVSGWQNDKSPSRLTHISNLLSEIKTESADLLNQLQFKDSNTQAFVIAIIQDSIDLAGLVPIVTQKAGASGGTEIRMRASLPAAKSLKEVFTYRLKSLPK